MATPTYPHILPENIGRHEVRELLGSGGAATIYKAFDTVLHRDVVVKVLHPHLLNTGAAPRIRREGRALACFRHPAIPGIIEVIPHRLTGGDQPLSPKSIHNVWVTLSSFFSWASTEFDLPNPRKEVPAPRFERAPVDPFSKGDVKALTARMLVPPPRRSTPGRPRRHRE